MTPWTNPEKTRPIKPPRNLNPGHHVLSFILMSSALSDREQKGLGCLVTVLIPLLLVYRPKKADKA